MFGALTAVTKIRENRANAVGLTKSGGVYKWWCERELLEEFLEQLKDYGSTLGFNEVEPNLEQCTVDGKRYYCFYVGMTKAKKGLAGRIKGNHIGKRGKKVQGRAINSSTLRKSINALKNGAENFDEEYVDGVLDKCLVQWVELQSEEIDGVEVRQINLKSYIRVLNNKGVDCKGDRKIIREALKKSRKK